MRTPEGTIILEGAKTQAIAAGFRPAPLMTDNHAGEVAGSSPDGVYFNITPEEDDLQLLIVGPMKQTPGEMAQQVGGWVRSVSALDCAGKNRQLCLERGFFSVIVRFVPEDAPAG